MCSWKTKLPSFLTLYALSFIAVGTAVEAQLLEDVRPQVVFPGNATQVVLSNQDVNRVVCLQGKVDGYKYSSEKGATVSSTGSEAFVKFQIRRIGEEEQYVNSRNEFYFICNGVTYTLITHPRTGPAQTIFLSSGDHGMAQENAVKFKALSEEDRAVTISLEMLRDDIPASYKIHPSNEGYKRQVLPRLDVRLRREVDVVGTPYKAQEFLIRARSEVKLDEKLFLSRFFGSSIYAVTLEKLALGAGEVGRVVIIYRGEDL